jgi:hypothetical protein
MLSRTLSGAARLGWIPPPIGAQCAVKGGRGGLGLSDSESRVGLFQVARILRVQYDWQVVPEARARPAAAHSGRAAAACFELDGSAVNAGSGGGGGDALRRCGSDGSDPSPRRPKMPRCLSESAKSSESPRLRESARADSRQPTPLVWRASSPLKQRHFIAQGGVGRRGRRRLRRRRGGGEPWRLQRAEGGAGVGAGVDRKQVIGSCKSDGSEPSSGLQIRCGGNSENGERE